MDMNCRKYQVNIYLYPEITEEDRTCLREHMQGCKECRELFESVTDVQRLTSAVAALEVRPSDASKLTRKIMEGIPSKNKPVGWEQIMIRLQGGRVRFALAVFSAFLILLFVDEHYQQPRQPRDTEQLAVARVLLSPSVWRERLTALKEKKEVCSSPFLSTSDRLLCLKNKLIAARP